MLRPIFLFLCGLLLSAPFLFGQKTQMPFPATAGRDTVFQTASCAIDLLLNQNRQNAAFKAAEEKMNRDILRVSRSLDATIITLPVVFHIVDNNPSFFTDADVDKAIRELNDAFGKTGAFAGSAGADTKIRFCLAKKDAVGGITTGITRTVSPFGHDLNPLIEDARLKNLVQWDPARFINIWYVRNMHLETMARFQCGDWMRGYAGGYATMPPGGGPLDGIVVSGLGNLLTHEMGHYLGLYHTFEGLNCQNNNCTTDGDRVCDTPPDWSMGSSSSCSSPENSCSSDTLSGYAVDQPDPIHNFMDYGNDPCHNEFTQGQADRMRAAITTQRPGLLENKCEPPCTEAILAGFSRDKAHPLPNETIAFTNTSSGASRYEWLLDGAVVATTSDFSRAFPAAGKYSVTLKAYGGSACFSSFTHDVIVTCGVTSRFYTNKRQLASKSPIYIDSIRFTNASVGGASYQWLLASDRGMAEQVVSTAKDLTYVFTEPGNYTMRLVATNGSCSDTTLFFTIPVLDPTPDGALYFSNAECYQETKVRLFFYVCNYGYQPLPEKSPITFYDKDPRQPGAKKLGTFYTPAVVPGLCCSYLYSTILDIGYKGLNTVYGVFSDSGKTVPVVLPTTGFGEKDYGNNISRISNFAFRVSASPSLSTLEWGDTLQLRAQAFPGSVSSYVWSSVKDLTCTTCQNPLLIADSGTVKQVIATSYLGCTDTARITVRVPPYNDFSIEVNDVQCARGDSLSVQFTIKNSFKRAVIPKGLTVAFYQGDPTGSGAAFLPQLFTVPDTVKGGQATFFTRIKSGGTGKIYGVVNDTAGKLPIVFPALAFQEKGYGNNYGSFSYNGFQVTATPATSILEWGDTLQLSAAAGPGIVSSYTWSTGKDLSCTTCQNPLLIADSGTTKRVVATSNLGCTDTARITVQVPPYNDFTVEVNDVQCAKGDSLAVQFTIKNSFKRAVIPKGLTVAFYKGDPTGSGAAFLPRLFFVPDTVRAGQASFTTIIKSLGTGKIYGVVNDTAGRLPIVFPTHTFQEKGYGNNYGSFTYTGFTVSATPATAIMEWGDTLQLSADAGPGTVSSYRWNTAVNLSCTACQAPVFVADTTTRKRVIAMSALGCSDTAFVAVSVPPYNDFTVVVKDVQCARGDSLFVNFTVHNSFKRAVLPKTLSVAFYNGDPRQGGAVLLQPVFTIRDTIFAKNATFSTFIKGMAAGNLYAVVNDSAKLSPVVFPATSLLEKAYTNNVTLYAYKPEVLQVSPADTTVFRKSSFPLQLHTTIYNPASTVWSTDRTIPVSCNNCPSPMVGVYHNTVVNVQTENGYGCLLAGSSTIKIFPPDMKVTIEETSCFTNDTALVTFRICMNNGYDTVWSRIPVSFYDGDPSGAGTRLLQTAFYTTMAVPDTCAVYTLKVNAPRTGTLVAVVNDKGDNRSTIPSMAFPETNNQNNVGRATYTPFTVSILPADTLIDRLTGITLMPAVRGGTVSRYLWAPAAYLSCTDCPAPFATPPYTTEFFLSAQNEAFCTDTAMAIIRTHSQEGIYLPTAFTPNGDGRNDVFYVMAGKEVRQIKSFSVYNRWGQVVHTVQNVPANTPLHGWRGYVGGKEAPTEVYVYYVVVRLLDGREKTAKGTVTLIR